MHTHKCTHSIIEYTITYYTYNQCFDQYSRIELVIVAVPMLPMLRPLQQVFFFGVQQAEDGTTQQVQSHRLGHGEGQLPRRFFSEKN